MKEIVLKTNNLTKKYKHNIVLNSVNITINKGEIYGLIGRNGAGKTTLMKLITTLVSPTSGNFYLFDKSSENDELFENKQRVGSLIEYPAFFPNLSAYDNLKYYAIQRGIVDRKQIDKVLEKVNLTNTGKKKVKAFSLGMKQRLGIALAILNNPDFIILDEPINGLDPIGISELREVFKKLSEEGVTLLISSHILSELYITADKFGFIEKGKLVKELTKDELDNECSKCIVIKTIDIKKACVVLEKQLNIKNYKVINKDEIRIYDSDKMDKICNLLAKNDINIKSIYESGISLEEYFKEVVKGGI